MVEHRNRKKLRTQSWAWRHRNKAQRQMHERPREEPPRTQNFRDTAGLEKYLAASDRRRGARLMEEEESDD
jgi:hypothetical protein